MIDDCLFVAARFDDLKSLDDLRRAAQDYLDQRDLFAVDETYLDSLLDKNGENKRRRR